MEEPPPVPPKDPGYTAKMDIERPSTAPSSGSKRKRAAQDDTIYNLRDDGFLEPIDPDAHTPKRRRSPLRQSDGSASEDITPVQRNVRRKKGQQNLSNLNLRHAAEKQASLEVQTRESRFQEGSLTDKPSEMPPSVFTRMIRTDSGNIQQIDELMADYYDGMPTPRDSVEAAIEREKALIPQRMAEIDAEAAKKEEGKGFFQFGRQLAANFHPVSLWNRVWNDTKEELRQKDMAEAERKARQKAEVEAKYAQMKQAGQFELQPVGRLFNVARSSGETPRDSGVVVDSLRPYLEHKRSISTASGLMPPKDDATSRSGSEVPETGMKSIKGLKSRLHFKKPSLTNFKGDLKRVKSSLDLSAVAGNRESSSSVSPIKTDFDGSALKKSSSKFDLRKQNKLSKRVSDLETKLQQARRELDVALVESSPMPKLTGKYERFTPNATIRKPKFVPGRLPSLPSERILMAEQLGFETNSEGGDGEIEPRQSMDLKEFLESETFKDETIKARARDNDYPARASSLFKLDDGNIEYLPSANKNNKPNHLDYLNLDNTTQKPPELQQNSSEAENMDPNIVMNSTGDSAPEPAIQADYASLDAKLKALNANVKTARRAAKPKKRKSGVTDRDQPFKPGTETDDDSEWEEATPKKKRKSTGTKTDSSPQNKGTTKQTSPQSSPQGKKGKGSVAKTNGTSSSPQAKKGGKEDTIEEAPAKPDEVAAREDEYSTDELADEQQPPRTSLDSVGHPLDPVYEEEEDTSMVPLKDEPSKPTAKVTPARYGRNAMRSRSNSPHKRSGSAQPGVEEQMITRAAEAAQQNPARQGRRSASTPPIAGYTETTTVIDETVTVKPGEDGVPGLPKGVNGSFESLDEYQMQTTEVEWVRSEKESNDFQWPDDVF